MVQFKPTFKPGLLISSPAVLHHLFRRYDKTMATEEWYMVFPGGALCLICPERTDMVCVAEQGMVMMLGDGKGGRIFCHIK